ncbi:MAG: response regulator [Oscillospiraceae bacterium]|nr:response regulator [Oscillospiraceae bacterium]
MKDLVLIVDDVDINRILLANILEDEYDTIEAADGPETLDILFKQNIRPTAILLDIVMPGMDGFEVIREIKNNPETEKIPVLFITAAVDGESESRGLKSGAADYISKEFNADVVRTRLRNHISLARYQNELESLVEIKTAELTRTYDQMLEAFATLVEYRSLESGTHIKRTSMLSELMINRLMSDPKYRAYMADTDITPAKAHSIVRATSLHDIGKIGITDAILLKPGRLTEEEFEEMKKHTVIGGKIIDGMLETFGDSAGYLSYCREIAYYHHERWDGLGYPTGLSEKDIPFSARLLSIVDVYDALVNQRCYKPPFSHEEAMSIITESRGKQFDPVLVDVFVETADKFEKLEDSLKD